MENINEIREEIRIAEANGDKARAEALKKKLEQSTVNG